jgi:uncharacterized protein (TIGR03086 family)
MSGSAVDDAAMDTHLTSTTDAPFADLPADDPRHLIGQAVATARATIVGVDVDRLHDPTPCEGMDVLGLVAHLVPVVERTAVVGRGGNILTVPPRLADLDVDQLLAAWDERVADLADAWADDATLRREVRLPWATLDGAGALRMYVAELTLHTWDLAVATGQRPQWHAGAVDAALAQMHAMLPAEGRTAEYEAVVASMPPGTPTGGQPFGEVVAVPDDAPAIDRLLGWTGRDPAWH